MEKFFMLTHRTITENDNTVKVLATTPTELEAENILADEREKITKDMEERYNDVEVNHYDGGLVSIFSDCSYETHHLQISEVIVGDPNEIEIF